tara:strand:- start:72 stop:722 length:651 start_codon:yes stop_codon:yes gene_type:complete
MLNFNEADEQFSGSQQSDFTPIPEGTIVDVLLTIRPGGAGEGGLLKQSTRSDAQYLDCEFTVTNGEFERRKFWTNLTVMGGSLDDNGRSKAGNISMRTIRAMLESCYNIEPRDMSDAAKAVRVLSSYGDLNNLVFKTSVGIEEYNEKKNNKLDRIIVPGMPEYTQPKGPDGLVRQPKPSTQTVQTTVDATPIAAQGTVAEAPSQAPANSSGKPSWA